MLVFGNDSFIPVCNEPEQDEKGKWTCSLFSRVMTDNDFDKMAYEGNTPTLSVRTDSEHCGWEGPIRLMVYAGDPEDESKVVEISLDSNSAKFLIESLRHSVKMIELSEEIQDA